MLEFKISRMIVINLAPAMVAPPTNVSAPGKIASHITVVSDR